MRNAGRPERDTAPDPDGVRLERIVRHSRRALFVERIVGGFWPVAVALALTWSALAFGISDVLAPWQLLSVLGVAGAGVLALVVIGLRRFRRPSRAQAVARIDADLPGRPLAALGDAPALGREDAGALAVWAVHLARMRARAAGAQVARPDPQLTRRDPHALRLMAAVVLIAAVMFANGEGLRGVGAALAPARPVSIATGPSFEGWAVPPAYTGRPTLYLPEMRGDRTASVPVGTVITLRGYGPVEGFALAETVSQSSARPPETGDASEPEPMRAAAAGIATAEFTLARSGSVVLRQDEADLGAWSFAALADAAPRIELSQPVERTVAGETTLGYTARDDFGVVAVGVEIALDLGAVDRRYGLVPDPVPRPAINLDLPLPMTGGGPEVSEVMLEDFSKHPFAGLPVTLTLSAKDASNQTGTSEVHRVVLPGRRFYDPLAAALVEQRRDLLWSSENTGRVARVLRAASHRPDDVFDSERAYLITRIAIRRLEAARAVAGDPEPVIAEVAEMLWRAALLLEEGSLGDAAERLAQARERLSEALRGDATDEEIAQLMEELRQATRDYMQQLAQEAIERGESQQAENQPQGQEMTQDQIQQLMDRIQELSEQGRRAEAEALLEQLQQLLENMEMRLAEGGGQGEGAPGEQAMQGLSDALRGQQGLADESFRQLQREFEEGRQGTGGAPGEDRRQGAPGPGEPREGEDGGDGEGGTMAERQQALRDRLRDLQRNLPGEAGEAAREALREAERDMGAAGDNLREGDTADALDQQADAIERMREGMREMSQDMREARQGQSGDEGEAQARETTDPLGRQLGSDGGLGTGRTMLPEGDAKARARALFDEIRRRSGDLGRPQIELDYLERLLDRF